MTSKLIVNSLAADTGVSTITFADQAKMGNSLFHSTGFTIGDSFLHSTGVNLTNVNATGVITATKFVGEVSVGSSITFEDNEKAYFGTSTDFSIYHNGSASYLDETGTGGLIAKTNTAFQVFNSAGSQPAFTVTPGGAVDLYHNTTKVLETKGYGVAVTGAITSTGNIDINDNVKLLLGTSDDYEVYHDGSNAVHRVVGDGDLKLLVEEKNFIVQGTGGHQILKGIDNGAVEIYHNNSKKLETQTNGTRIYDSLGIGTDSTSDVFLSIRTPNGTSGSPSTKGGVIIRDGSYANGKLIDFQNSVGFSDISVDGSLNMNFANNHKLQLGDSQEIKLYHDGTHSRITNSTGFLALQSDSFRLYNAAGSENMIDGTANGSVNLYYDNSKKFETTSSGATITGNLAFPSGNGIDFSATADGSGSGQYELLDDYEEGNWTPTVENGSGAFYVYSAKYTKIGRQVGIQFYMQLNNGAGNGNGVSIGGLPFAVRSNGWTCAKVSTGYNNSGVHCRAKAGTSAIDIKGPADQSVTFSNINGTWILSSFVYFTDS